MQFQRCPSCRERNDVSVYVHGQFTRCSRCGIRFTVDRENLASSPNEPKVEHRATEISLVRGGVDELVATKSPFAGGAAAAPEPAPPPPAPPPIDSAQLFPTPAQRPNSPARNAARADAPTEAAAPAQPRPNIPGFECLLLLGRGGMGEVWKAQQLSLGRTVAVKLLSPTLAVEPDFVRRFERESSALAALAHPHIVSVFDRGSANGHWYFIMEYIEGRSLRDRLADGPISRADLLRLLAQVSRAVDYAHQKGVIHRDLKPENILVDHVGHAKVADFGLAGMSEHGRSSLTMSAVAMGTAHYMAPEQRRDAKKVDGRADLYSIGVMLYELLTGEVPAGRFPAPREKVKDLDAALDEMIMRLLDQDPLKRPARASDVAELLERLSAEARGERAVVAPANTTKILSGVVREVRANPQKKAMFAGAAALLALVLAIAIGRSVTPTGDARLAAKIDRQTGRASVAFGDGAPEAILAVGDGWQSLAEGLVRDSSAKAGKREPRAYLMPVRLDFTDAAIETDVHVEPAGGLFGGDDPPRVELVLYRDEERHVGLRMSLAEDASYSLFHAAPVKGKTVRREEEGASVADPRPGRTYHLELFVVNGRATAFVDKRQVASAAVPGLAGTKAKAALGCRDARCRFTNVRLAGALADPPSPPNARK